MSQSLKELIQEYWDAAYLEGKEGRTEDTKDGNAQRIWSAIESKIDEDAKDAKEAEWMRGIICWNVDNFNDLPLPDTYYKKWLDRVEPMVEKWLTESRNRHPERF